MLLIPNYAGSILVILIIIGESILISKYFLLLNRLDWDHKNSTLHFENIGTEMIGILIGNIEDMPSVIFSIAIGEHYGYSAITTLCLIISLISLLTKIAILLYSKYLHKNTLNGYNNEPGNKTTETIELAMDVNDVLETKHPTKEEGIAGTEQTHLKHKSHTVLPSNSYVD
eukprot:132219_1